MDSVEIIELTEENLWQIAHSILTQAHKENIEKGLVVSSTLFSASQMRSQLGEGKCFLAKVGSLFVGVAAVSIRQCNQWYSKDKVAHFLFDAILPSYRGLGIYRMLQEKRYEYVKENQISIVTTSTAVGNKRMVLMLPNLGFRRAVFFRVPTLNHYSIKWVKWLEGGPSNLCCWLHYNASLFNTLAKHFLCRCRWRERRA